MNDDLKEAYYCFFKHDYKSARPVFAEFELLYEAGVCSFLLKELHLARRYFAAKEKICPASAFGLIIIDILQNKKPKEPKYFQIRSFLEIYLNLMIENKLYDWAQKIIDSYEFFAKINYEVPKFIARVLNANGYDKTIHTFAKAAKQVCFFDAEIYYIDASVYLKQNNFIEAKNCIEQCISFAPDYYPILQLKKQLMENQKY